jgi:hypothetical protein
MKKYQTDIPEEIYTYLVPLLYRMSKLSVIDVRRPAVAAILGRESLREWIGDRRDKFIPALKWALAHSDRDYRVFVPEQARDEFTNADCLKLMGLYLRSLEHLDDEGPDIVEPVDLVDYLRRYPDGNFPDYKSNE